MKNEGKNPEVPFLPGAEEGGRIFVKCTTQKNAPGLTCPEFLNLEAMAPATAWSTLALSKTMKGAWPPSSMDTLFTEFAAWCNRTWEQTEDALSAQSTTGTGKAFFKKVPNRGGSQVHSSIYGMTVCIRNGENYIIYIYSYLLIFDKHGEDDKKLKIIMFKREETRNGVRVKLLNISMFILP